MLHVCTRPHIDTRPPTHPTSPPLISAHLCKSEQRIRVPSSRRMRPNVPPVKIRRLDECLSLRRLESAQHAPQQRARSASGGEVHWGHPSCIRGRRIAAVPQQEICNGELCALQLPREVGCVERRRKADR